MTRALINPERCLACEVCEVARFRGRDSRRTSRQTLDRFSQVFGLPEVQEGLPGADD